MNKRHFLIIALFILLGNQNILAQSTVYFFVDFRFLNSEYLFTVNGQEAFKLIPEGKPVSKNLDLKLYNMVARKVIFNQPGSYVISTDCPSSIGIMQAELNLNLTDGETYYVLINSTIKRNFYMELLNEKKGLKLLKKATKSKKYTFNEDIIYDTK